MELWLVILLLVVVVLHWIAARALLQRTDGRMVVLVVLGSGGHTSEMLSMLGALEERLKRGIVFVVAETDKMSQQRAARLFPRAEFVKTPRAREVHQSWLTTVLTTFVAALHAIKIVFEQQPDLVRPQNVREFSVWADPAGARGVHAQALHSGVWGWGCIPSNSERKAGALQWTRDMRAGRIRRADPAAPLHQARAHRLHREHRAHQQALSVWQADLPHRG